MIRYMMQEASAGYGHRIYVESADLNAAQITALNALSCWGGADKSGANFKSWEFPETLPMDSLRVFANRLGLTLSVFDLDHSNH